MSEINLHAGNGLVADLIMPTGMKNVTWGERPWRRKYTAKYNKTIYCNGAGKIQHR